MTNGQSSSVRSGAVRRCFYRRRGTTSVLTLAVWCFLAAGPGRAESLAIATLAGMAAQSGSSDGTGKNARFSNPNGVAVDSSGYLYVADTSNHTIRKISPGGVVSTLAGFAGSTGSADGTGSAARFYYPYGVAVGNSGNIYVADTYNHTIRMVTPAGVVTTLAGTALNHGVADGTGSAARFYSPQGLAVDGSGNVYVADTSNHTVRKITPARTVSTLAGLAGSSGSADGTGSAARFRYPFTVAVDGSGNVYVADTYNHTVRAITPGQVVSTLAGLAGSSGSADGTGSAANFNNPSGVAVDGSGNVWVADTINHTVRKVTGAGVVSTLAGLPGVLGSTDGIGSAARFCYPRGVAVDSAGILYVANTSHSTIRCGVEGAPVLTSAATASGYAGQAFNYSITASNFPTSYNASPLPAGLAVNTSNGAIAGTPTAGGTSDVTISATNALGTGSATLTITINLPSPPVITSATTASGTVERAFSYQITASNNPTSYDASPLPAGLAVNTSTGAITGTPRDADTTSATISATNAGGTGSATLTITLALPPPPSITSATATGGTVGLPFSYQITATNSPTSYNAGPLPDGLSVNTGTGAITGTPTTAGTTSVTISATNAGGTGTTMVTTSIIMPPPPVITSAAMAGGVLNMPFNYQITGSNIPTSFSATSLPDGLSVNTGTGAITGTPLSQGTTLVTIGAANAGGTASAELTIMVSTPLSLATLAGLAGNSGSTDGTGSEARFFNPCGVAVDNSGNVYVADTNNHTIRKIAPGGVVSTLAGLPGTPGSSDGQGSTARFNSPQGVAVDSSGNIYVADTYNDTIRKITPAGVVTTLAGSAGSGGGTDGTGSSARFGYATGLAVDSLGIVYVADNENSTIRRITPGGVVSTLAGLAMNNGSADGQGSTARFLYPYCVALDGSGNVYVTDTDNHTIRKITPAGVVSTFAGLAGSFGSRDGVGSAARFYYPFGIVKDSSGDLYVTDGWNHTIRRITPQAIVTTVAGSAQVAGSADGTGSAARFDYPGNVAVDNSGIVYVADIGNKTIRRGVLVPLITSLATASGTVGIAFNYQITASSNPTNYSATNLPSWAHLDTTTGIITGTPDAVGSTNVKVYAANSGGTGSATLALTINRWSQTITFNALPPIVSDAPDFYPGAKASSGLAVTYASSNTAVATIVNGVVHLIAPGSTTITASQGGNSTYDPAPDVQQPLTVVPATPLEVFVRLTIPGSVSIAWGSGTTGKTAGDVTPFDWTVLDATGSQLGHGETCVSNDANNNMAMNLGNTSNTGTNARVFAGVANSGGWNIASAPATDTFAIMSLLGTNPQAALAAAAQELTGTATLAKGADQPLVVTVLTPTDITRNAGVQKTIFVVLTATPE